MRIEHVAIWVEDLEIMKDFYEAYFDVQSGPLYHNEKKGFKSYFLTFDSGSRLEIMKSIDIHGRQQNNYGYAHIALSVGDKEKVDRLTEKLVDDGFDCLNGPRKTGDGYYESVISDPEGNLIELTTD